MLKAIQAKTDQGRFFEDFRLGETIEHATPRTLTDGERALYTALYPTRFAVYSADSFARSCGLKRSPLEDLIGFHTAFGKTVPDISLNAVANLGYAECRFLQPVYAGDTLSTTSEVIGLKQNSSGKTGVVWVRSTARNQRDAVVMEWVRWVMVHKSDPDAVAPETVVPSLSPVVPADQLRLPAGLDFSSYDFGAAGSAHCYEDYEIGEIIDHVDGVTLEEAEHMMATRLWQNTAKVHFNKQARPDGKRLIYGGHIISLARALSFNGLANAQMMLAINGGSHTAPSFAGDTIYARSEILDKAELTKDAGALRIRLCASKLPFGGDVRDADGKYLPEIVLDLDYWAVIPRSV